MKRLEAKNYYFQDKAEIYHLVLPKENLFSLLCPSLCFFCGKEEVTHKFGFIEDYYGEKDTSAYSCLSHKSRRPLGIEEIFYRFLGCMGIFFMILIPSLIIFHTQDAILLSIGISVAAVECTYLVRLMYLRIKFTRITPNPNVIKEFVMISFPSWIPPNYLEDFIDQNRSIVLPFKDPIDFRRKWEDIAMRMKKYDFWLSSFLLGFIASWVLILVGILYRPEVVIQWIFAGFLMVFLFTGLLIVFALISQKLRAEHIYSILIS